MASAVVTSVLTCHRRETLTSFSGHTCTLTICQIRQKLPQHAGKQLGFLDLEVHTETALPEEHQSRLDADE